MTNIKLKNINHEIITMNNDIIINFPIFYDCYICLHNEKENMLKMKCCSQPIHQFCLFETFLNNYKKCPMCRTDMNVKEYFDKNSLDKCIKEMSVIYKFKYIENILSLYNELNIYNVIFKYYKDIFLVLFFLTIYISVVILYTTIDINKDGYIDIYYH